MARSGDTRQELGQAGEGLAASALRRVGLQVIAARFRTRHGEIDLIAQQGDLLVFVEVKTRRGRGYGWPAEAVTARKRRRMARVAAAFLQRHRARNRPCRFDVVEVEWIEGREPVVEHIVDAFRLSPSDGDFC